MTALRKPSAFIRNAYKQRAFRPAWFSLVFLALCGCGAVKRNSPAGTITIGFVMDSLVEERWTRDRNIFISSARRRGAEVIVQTGEENAADQEAQINYLLDEGINVLVLVASDPNYLAKSVMEVRRRGIPVMLYERLVYNAGANLFLAFDGESVGKLQAEEMLRRTKGKRGTVLIYNGVRGDFYAEAVHRGILDTLQEPLERREIAIAGDHWPETSRAEEAFAYISDYLEDRGPVDGIITLNDLQAEAVIRALALKRLAGQVAVIGADADLSACQRIVEGTQAMTVYKPISYIAATAADLAIYLAQDKRFTIHHAVYDGSFRIPYYRLFPAAVTADNMEETVIRDGFHLRDEVYRNILP